MLTFLAALLVISQCQAADPNNRFNSASRCLANGGSSSCIVCDTTVTVGPTGQNCRDLQNEDLIGRVCDRLEDVVESIARQETRHRPGGCIEVLIHPKVGGEAHVVQARDGRVIQQSVVFRGLPSPFAPVGVTLALDDVMDMGGGEGGAAEVPQLLYAFRFANLLTVFSSLQFLSSPGSIEFSNVEVVAIESSSFRFFDRGAVDVYNCLTLLVSASKFSHNTFNSITKDEPYRGHSAGLSIAYDSNPGFTMLGPLVRISDCSFRNNSVESEPVAVSYDPDRSGFVSNFEATNTIINNTNNNDNNNNDNNDNNNNDNNKNRNKGPGNPFLSVSEQFDTRGQLFRDQILIGRGGGVALIVNADSAAEVEILGCDFLENTAAEFGGGLYVLLQGATSHSVSINRNSFTGNVSPSTGGGLHITFLSEGAESESSRVLILQNTFSGNQASYGGGAFFLPLTFSLVTSPNDSRLGVSVSFQECTFTGNDAVEVGGALGVGLNLPVASIKNTPPMRITDCYFDSNFVRGAGIVSIANFPASFHGNNTFIQNRGPSLALVGSLVDVFGSLEFLANGDRQSLYGGALYVTSLAQLQLNPGTRILFRNNKGTVGAAVVITNIRLPFSLSGLLNNPLCTFLFSDRSLTPDEWLQHNVSMEMTGNSAIVSSGVYVNNIDLCSWRSYQLPYFDRQRAFNWDFTSYVDNSNSAHGNPLAQRFAVQSPPVRINVINQTVVAFPGEAFSMRIFARDELDIPTLSVVGFLDVSSDGSTSDVSSDNTQNLERYRFSPASVSLREVNPRALTQSLRFSVLGERTGFGGEEISVRAVGGTDSITHTVQTFSLIPRSCPPGRGLRPLGGMSGESSMECVCDTDRQDIMDCDGNVITMGDLLWSYSSLDDDGNGRRNRSSVTDTMSDRMLTRPFHTFPCPQGYCRCTVQETEGNRRCRFMSREDAPNDQCQCNRTGVLCGGCAEGFGVSALLNSCVSCDSSHVGLIVGLIVADIILICLIVIFTVSLPSWVYPSIFYLQILPHLTKHFPVTFEKLSPYLYYIGSALGLYFPYDFCLHSNLTTAPAYALRYIPVLVAIPLASILQYTRARNKRFRAAFHADSHGVWCLFLLLYTPLLHTSMSLLDCPALSGERLYSPRWYANANIKCFQDAAHAPLGLLALFVLVCCVCWVPLVVLVATKKLTRPYWIHHFVAPLTAPYKSNCGWWCGVELGKRVVLVLFAVAFKGNDYAAIFFLVILLTFTGFFKPYKTMIVTVLDLLYSVDIFILLSLRNTVDLEDTMHVVPRQSTVRGDRGCGDVEGYTPFVLLLVVFYYMPVLLALVVLLVWISWKLHLLAKNNCIPVKAKEELELSGSLPLRTRTQTVVEMSKSIDSSPVPSGERKFSFMSHRPHIKTRKNFLRIHSSKRAASNDPSSPHEEFPLQDLPQESDRSTGTDSGIPDSPSPRSPLVAGAYSTSEII